MQKLFVTLSQKQIGELYHYTNKHSLLKILRSGKLGLSTGRARGSELEHQGNKNFFASFTRSRFGGYHYQDGGKVSNHGDTDIMVTLDGTKLSNKYKIVPIDYWGHRGELEKLYDSTKEVEERLISNNSEIDIIKYIKRIDFIQSGNALEKEKYFGFDGGGWKKTDNERFENRLGSIILQLKKSKIPYAFYNSMNDWARKRSEYSYIGKKGIDVGSSNSRPSAYGYTKMKALLECFSTRTYERLSEEAKKLCSQAYSYPRDIDSIFSDYENNRKPGSDQVKRDIALKIANAMQRLNINSKQDAGKFISAKYEVYVKAQDKIRDAKINAELAPLFVEALHKNIADWSTVRVYNSPLSIFSSMDSVYGYLGEDAARTVKGILDSDGTEIDKFKQEAKKLELGSAMSIVSYIYNNNVKAKE